VTDQRTASIPPPAITQADVFRRWWPLGLSWLIMTLELVVITAFVARTAAPEIQLAAWGVAFAISTLIQAPATALLPASTALSTNVASFVRLRGYAGWMLGSLTAVHLVIATTPMFSVVTGGIMGVPRDVMEATQPALLFMTPWAIGTGYRRFLQGALIRFGEVRIVIAGSLLRLVIGTIVLAIGISTAILPGAQLAAIAIIVGVLTELQYTRMRFARALVSHGLMPDEAKDRLTFARFVHFMYPLVVMTVLTMVVQSLVTIVLGRMPEPLIALAIWPVLFGLLAFLQSAGLSYTEVVISMIGQPDGALVLQRFTWTLTAVVTAVIVMMTITPIADLWFTTVAGLSVPLAQTASVALLAAAAVPGLRVLQGWYQGVIMHRENNRGILESVLVFLAVASIVFIAGIVTKLAPGLYVGVFGLTLGMLAQAAWLRHHAMPILRDAHPPHTLEGMAR